RKQDKVGARSYNVAIHPAFADKPTPAAKANQTKISCDQHTSVPATKNYVAPDHKRPCRGIALESPIPPARGQPGNAPEQRHDAPREQQAAGDAEPLRGRGPAPLQTSQS